MAELERVQLWRRSRLREMEADLERRNMDFGEAPFAPTDPVSERVGRKGSTFVARESRNRLAGFRVD